MEIDASDVKILINSSFHLVLKSCWQCLKDHPIVFVFVLFLLNFYIFLPSLLNVLFYISPLVICTAIVLQRQINLRYQSATNTTKSADGSNKVSNENRTAPQGSVTPRTRLRPTIDAAMSRRTFKKQTYKESGTPVMADFKDDIVFRCLSDVMPMKSREKDVAYGSNYSVGLASNSKEKGKGENVIEGTQEDGKAQAQAQELKEEKGKFVVEWTEDDKRNQMDLDFSDHRRLESLIVKRRVKKTLSMVPQRNLQGHFTPILTERFRSDTEGQPGSAPSVLLPTKNPFDLPYDPSEEKPVLIGDGFEKEFFITQPKDMYYSKHESFSYGPPFVRRHVEDPPSKSACSVFSNPMASYGTRFQRHSDARENIYKFSEQLSREVQVKNIKNGFHEEASVSPQKAEDNGDRVLVEPGDAKEEQGPDTQVEDKENALIEDDNYTSSSSSIEETCDPINSIRHSPSIYVTTVLKNEAFRKSVTKVLTCIVQKNRSATGQQRTPPLDDYIPSYVRPTKTEEPTKPVLEGGSPVLNDEANYPADSESLVFGGGQNSSVNSDDEGHNFDNANQEFLREANPQYSQQNLQSSKDIDIDSTDANIVFDPRESSREESENMNMPDTNDCLVNEYVDKNCVLDEDDEYQQHASLDLDFGSIESSCGSVSPDTHQASVAQQITTDTGTSSPKIRLQDNLQAVGSASTSTEQNIDTYIHLPSTDISNDDQRIVFREGGDSMLQHSFQASFSPSVEMGEPEVLDLNSSPRSLLISPDERSSLNSPSPRSNIIPLQDLPFVEDEKFPSQNGNKDPTEHSHNPASLAMQSERFVEQVPVDSDSSPTVNRSDGVDSEGISNLPRSREEHTTTTSKNEKKPPLQLESDISSR